MFYRFLLVGGVGFLIDAGLTHLLVLLDVRPWIARIPAITLAMLFTWLANRHFTYRVDISRSVREATRYAAAAAVLGLVNYLVYVILVRNGVWPVTAVTFATALQTIVSFHVYRRFVFTRAH